MKYAHIITSVIRIFLLRIKGVNVSWKARISWQAEISPMGGEISIGDGKWTAKVFRTGKIILTGINDESEVHSFISELMSLFEKVLPAKSLKFDTSNTVVRSSAPKAR